MKKSFKMMFTLTLIMSSLMAVSSNNWLGMWIGLEINLMSIIPMMQNQMNKMSAESTIKYFATQTLASSIIIMALLMMMSKTSLISNMEKSFLNLMLISSLLLKMGMTPFHFWFIEIMEGLSWMNCMLMMTWQKLAPMIIVMYNTIFPMFTKGIIMMGLMLSGIMAMNQTSMRKLMAYSSINNMGWMMGSMMVSQTIWLYYFAVYTTMNINIIWLLMKNKISLTSQMGSMKLTPPTKMIFSLNFMNLGGLPPFLGFMPKWMTIEALINKNFMLMSMMMMITTAIMTFVYLKLLLSSTMMNKSMKNWNMNTKKPKSFAISMYNIINLMTLSTMTVIFNTI